LSTIRAETEGFRPIPEGKSRFNTSPGSPVPFNLYEPGTKVGRELGNTQVGDGARFKGRGFVQLTGRSNYREFGPQVGADLVANPDLADDPTIAGKLLGVFLRKSETAIRNALRAGNLREARKLVNGGENGFANFQDAYTRGVRVLPDGVAGARPNGAALPHAAMA